MTEIKIDRERISHTMGLYVKSFERVLYEEDTTFLQGMKENSLARDDIEKYKFWEWTQGVGLYGFWKLYLFTGNPDYLNTLTAYYDRQLVIGLPAKNVNTTAPLLALSFLAEHQNRENYMAVCREWADWMLNYFPRTREGGFQHLTSDTLNEQELWDDTLFMAVLFLANMGRILDRQDYREEAKYQFLVHIKYLTDRKTGLWFHGWTFNGSHNFAEGLWGRGNCWITAAIPELLEILSPEDSTRRFLVETLNRQAEALEHYQAEDGMWHTLVDEPDSYAEASATCGFAYGLLKGVHAGLLDPRYAACARKAIAPILELTDAEGILNQVSYGTPMGRESKQFYRDIEIKPMPYGQALAILFMLEVLNEKDEE